MPASMIIDLILALYIDQGSWFRFMRTISYIECFHLNNSQTLQRNIFAVMKLLFTLKTETSKDNICTPLIHKMGLVIALTANKLAVLFHRVVK